MKKLPRLFVNRDMRAGQTLTLDADQAHYLRHVLRKGPGDGVRVFNGRDGEWLGVLSGADKKGAQVLCERLLRAQQAERAAVTLIFAPIKKARLDVLIEKAVELGATALHPVLTQNTEMRALNEDRVRAQIVEAAEQCERLDMPVLHPLAKLEQVMADWPAARTILACLERADAPPMLSVLNDGPAAVLIGPEGGFSAAETAWITTLDFVRPVSLGPAILRSETAVCCALSAVGLHRDSLSPTGRGLG